MASESKPKVNIGCGLVAGASFVNIDGSFNAVLANYPRVAVILERCRIVHPKWRKWPRGIRYHDLRRELPFATSSVSAVYASHVLEHLTRADAINLVKEMRRVLCSGGVVRVIVPDLEALIRTYLEGIDKGMDEDPGRSGSGEVAGDEFLERSGLGRIEESPVWTPTGLYRRLTDYHYHKWMYDRHSMYVLLNRNGFEDIAEVRPLESRIEDIVEVERPDAIHEYAFGMEAVRV